MKEKIVLKGKDRRMEYVIYGAGYRGRRLFDYIKSEHVFAFIDMDEAKQGKEYCGKPIISIDEYKKKYMSCFIIITPAYYDDIEKILESNNIFQYCNLKGLPSEFAGYGDCGFEDCYNGLKKGHDEPFCIYGVNALSFMIYDFLSPSKEITIFPGENCKFQKLEWVKKYYPEIRLKECAEICNNEIILASETGKGVRNFTDKTLNLFEYANSNKQYWNGELLKFKNLYITHKRCFVVATGPSLRIDDLHILAENNVFCFGVNGILKIEKDWVPDAYVAVDSKFISDNMQYIKNYNCKLKFIGDSCREYWEKERDDSYKIHATKPGTMVDFSEDICQKIYLGHRDGGTVTYTCLQLAVYMGFKEIYLLGVDCNYTKGSKNNYFISDETEDNINHRENFMIQGYAYAKEYADNHGISIYNATRGGILEVFERVDFDSIFDDK